MSKKFQLKGGICEPCSDIPPNWKDMRSKFGYKLISKIRSQRSLILLIVAAGLRPVIVSFTRYAREPRLSAGYTKALRAIAYPTATLGDIYYKKQSLNV